MSLCRCVTKTPSAISHWLTNQYPLQLRFALSAETTARAEGTAFALPTLYWTIVEFLEQPVYEEYVAKLLEWWNE